MFALDFSIFLGRLRNNFNAILIMTSINLVIIVDLRLSKGPIIMSNIQVMNLLSKIMMNFDGFIIHNCITPKTNNMLIKILFSCSPPLYHVGKIGFDNNNFFTIQVDPTRELISIISIIN